MIINMNKTLSGPVGYKSQKWLLSLTRVVTYESFALQSLSDSVKWGLIKVVVTRAGCLPEWSRGEL